MRATIHKYCAILGLLLLPSLVWAQFYWSGQAPASQKWSQLRTAELQLIYPRGHDSLARYVLHQMRLSAAAQQAAVGLQAPSVPLLLYTQSSVSNAEVAWAPSRISFYHTPAQLSYSQEWYQQLAWHEYRHVLQLSLVQSALPKAYYWLLGQSATAIQLGLWAPYWLLEGEAVVAETAYTRSGRGRDPFFTAQLRAQLSHKGAYSLEKATLGSYKHMLPDRYHLGYYLVALAQQRFGHDFWPQLWRNIGRWRYPLPLAYSIKKAGHISKKQFYEQCMQQLTAVAKPAADSTARQITTHRGSYADYLYPAYADKGSVTALKKPFHDIAQVVSIDTQGYERCLFKPGYLLSEPISYAKQQWCWTTYQWHPRWYYKGWTKLMLYDGKTGKKRCLKRRSRLHAPALSPDGLLVAAIEVSQSNGYSIVVLRTHDGAEVQRFSLPHNPMLSLPKWGPQSRYLWVEATGPEGKSIWRIRRTDGRCQQLLPPTHAYRRLMQVDSLGNMLVGEDIGNAFDVYSYNSKADSLRQMTHTAYAVHSAYIQGDSMLYAAYTADGFRLYEQSQKHLAKPHLSAAISPRTYPLASQLSEAVAQYKKVPPPTLSSDSVRPQAYRKYQHLFRLHSWNPIFSLYDNSLAPGIHLQSQNSLSSMLIMAGAYYQMNKQAPNVYASLRYAAWYPELQADVIYKISEFNAGHRWNSSETRLGVALPLQFVSGLWQHKIKTTLSTHHEHISMLQGATGDYHWWYNSYTLNMSSVIQTTWQNMYPDWGWAAVVSHAHSWHGQPWTQRWYGIANVYLHGVFRHDGFRLIYAQQHTAGNSNFFSDAIQLARGFSQVAFDQARNWGVDYQLPIAYPDRALSSVLYVKRVVLGVFYEHSCYRQQAANAYIHSQGIEIKGDMHLLRSKFPVMAGLRIAQLRYDRPYKQPSVSLQFLLKVGL